MRLLISLFSPTTGTWGGLTRAVALAEAAQSAGHEVAFCASSYLEAALRARGYQVYPAPPTTMFGLPPSISRLLERRSQRVSLPVRPGRSVGSIWLVLLASGFARPSYLHHLVAAETEAARAFRADRLFTDLDPGAFLTSAVTGLPLAHTYAHIATHGSGSLPWKLMQRAVASVSRSYALRSMTPDQLLFGETVLKIIPSIPELDGTEPDRHDVRYVGWLIGEFQSPTAGGFQPERGRRYVFLYVGTGSVSLDTVEDILPQVFPADGDRVCVVGAQSITDPYRLGAVEFRPYVPADAVLPLCDWTICHGGQNTIIHSLLHSVPLLIFPGPIFERRYNAARVAVAGAGLMGEVNEFTVEWLRAAFEHQDDCAHQAAILGARIRSYGGPSAAVEAISNWSP